VKGMKKKQDSITTTRIERHRILRSNHPTHNERLWLAGNLLWCNQNDVDKVCDIIDQTSCWNDYSPRITRTQVKSVARTKRSGLREDQLVLSSFLEGKDLTSQEVDKLAKEFDWDKAQEEAFAKTERMRRCTEKDCYLKPNCYERPCRWMTRC
jgi:hypothetical protein